MTLALLVAGLGLVALGINWTQIARMIEALRVWWRGHQAERATRQRLRERLQRRRDEDVHRW